MKTYCFCFLLFMASANINAKDKVACTSYQQDKGIEDILIDKLFRLVEVKQLNIELKKYKASASVMITAKPTSDSPYYEVTVGYDGPSRFESRYFFRIKKDKIKQENIEPYIEVMDIAEADYVPLLQYRKKSK
ncbi:hypothetical protein G7092_23350 [Mucilaginibacter sp. HC2]|uniref:hypothetical protein n=1 Tax=Mucilaginibacter inviolabilis TaxID=2714892 RepID=UPI00140E7158|nr:hypothetical protein [Mucilaginibacter inviolabilis]NHA06759.1 hypothetical protein [Mucilaginibacter inviolabilis]